LLATQVFRVLKQFCQDSSFRHPAHPFFVFMGVL
jgi:hypothetical protein